MNYTRETVSGLAWISALRGLVRSSAIVKTVILARLLTPVQFGLFGIASLVLALLETVTETGSNGVLIQEQADLKEYIDTAWLTSILRGILIGLVLVAGALPIAHFFASPDSGPLVLLIASVPFIRGFINPSIISFQKDLHFNREFALRGTLAAVETLTAVAVGWATHSAIAIVWAMIASAICETVFSWVLVAPRPRLTWNPAQLNAILSRGKWVTAAGLFSYLFQEGDDIVVGKLLNTTSLGLYQTVYKIAILPITEIADVFGKVTFPVYSRIAGDPLRLRRAFVKITLGISLLTLPLSALIFFFPQQIINLVLGPQWLSAAPALRILAIFGGLRAISGSPTSLFMAVKKQKFVTAVTFVSVLGMGAAIIPFVVRFGLVGAAYAVLIGSVAALPVIGFCLSRVLSPHHASR